LKVFITGATGYIGHHVAKIFRINGHSVFGLTRNKKNINKLLKNEIIPVIGNIGNKDSFIPTAIECDLIIHAAVEYSEKSAELDKNFVKEITSIESKSKKKTFIYTSGCWVYGNTKGKADEKSELKPAKKVKWRHEVEEMVINSDNVNGVVIRPGCVYGKEGSLTNIWMNEVVNENKLSVIGSGKNHWAMIHVDDLADLFYKTYQSNAAKEYFNAVDNSRDSVDEIVKSISKVTGYKGEIKYFTIEEASHIVGLLAEPLAFDQHLDNSKAKSKLNWQPKYKGFVADVEIYYNSWKSNKN